MVPSQCDQAGRFARLFYKPVVLYGAGITGVETQKVLTNRFKGVSLLGFCDGHKSGFVNGLAVMSPQELQRIGTGGEVIVIATALAENRREILSSLNELGIPPDCVYTPADIDDLIVANADDERVDDWYREIRTAKRELGRRPGDNTYLDWWCPDHYQSGDVLVYQCGKVGSSTIVNSLARAGIGATHVHMLTDRFIYDLIPELAWRPDAAQEKLIQRCSDLCIERLRAERKLRIITLVREPLSRDFSSFVYHLNQLTGSGYGAGTPLVDLCADGMRWRATRNGASVHGYQFDWFEAELEAVFDIDVYARPFDQSRGYSIVRNDEVELLVLKLERLIELEPVIAEFVQSPEFRLADANRSSGKRYAELYRSLRREVRLPSGLLRFYYEENPLMNHFYGPAERRSMLAQWAANIEDADAESAL